jgi:hypothetical protein
MSRVDWKCSLKNRIDWVQDVLDPLHCVRTSKSETELTVY